MFGSLKRTSEQEVGATKSAKMSNGTSEERKATFARNLGALNSQFATWVAEQNSSAPKALWTDGVEDYLKYAKQLLADFQDVLEANDKPDAAAAAAAPAAAANVSFGAGLPPPAAAAGSSKPPLAPGMFGASSGQGGGGSAGGAGGAAAPPASIFSALPSTAGAFGLTTSAPGAGFGAGFGSGFGSGAANAANSGGSGLFNVPSTGTLGSSFNTATNGGGAAGAEDDEGEEEGQAAEPSVQLESVEGTEMLAKQRVKLMSMTAEKKWKDKGQGTLTLRRATGEAGAGKPAYFVFTTLSGRVLINAPLVQGMKPTSNPKAPASLIMFLISKVEEDSPEERGMHMFRCESADVAKQLLTTISEQA